MLCVEFPQVWYIDFSQIIQVLKAAVKLTSKQWNLSIKVFPERRLKPGFRIQKKRPRPLNIEVSL